MHETLKYDWDFYMGMDSNNLLSDDYIKRWIEKSNAAENRFFGSSSFIAIDSARKYMHRYNTKSVNRLSNVGRGVRRDVWERLHKVGSFVADKTRNDRLDGMTNYMAKKYVLGRKGYRHSICKGCDGVLDFKSEIDIHGDEAHIPTSRRLDIDIPFLLKQFPELQYWI